MQYLPRRPLLPPPLPAAAQALVLASSLALGACGGGSAPAEAPKSSALDAATAAAGSASGPLGAAPAPEAAASDVAAAASAASSAEPTVKAAAAAMAIDGNTRATTSTAKTTTATAAATTSATNAATTSATTSKATAVTTPVQVAIATAPAESAPVTAKAPAPAPSTSTATAAAPAPAVISYGAPIVISKGGTYTGNWESTTPATPAVTITTTEPVVIQNCNIRSVAAGVQSVYSNTQVTVRNCKALMNRPNVAGKSAWRFVSLYMPKSFVGENNDITGGGGFYIDGAGKGADLIRIRYNKQQNIDGRQSDGKGGIGTNVSLLQFVQLNNVQGIKDGEISWNQVVNQPYKSRSEDVINLYLARGLSTRKFPVQHNYIQGAYPAEPMKDGFSGGGIIVDGSAKTADTAAGYISITNNQVLSTTNYGIAISSGINSEIKNNRVISTGTLPTGEIIAAANVGLYIWDIGSNIALGSFYGNVASANEVYWMNSKAKRNDAWFPNCATGGCTGNVTLTTTALTTLAKGTNLLSATAATGSATSVEDVEYSTWQAKVTANAVKLGPQ